MLRLQQPIGIAAFPPATGSYAWDRDFTYPQWPLMSKAEPSAPPAATPSSPRRRDAARISGQLFLELLVVFSGVYAAFILSEHQQERQAAERRDQIRSALVEEIQVITANTGPVAASLPDRVAILDSLIRSGARPPLQPQLGLPRFDTHMWEYTLQSDALDLFDVASISALSAFYNELNAGLEQIDQLIALSESVLLPNLNEDADEFYDPDTGELRPKYRWYLEGLGQLGRIASRITERGDSLVAVMSP